MEEAKIGECPLLEADDRIYKYQQGIEMIISLHLSIIKFLFICKQKQCTKI